MLLENDVLRYKESGRVVRALWAHTEKKTMFMIDIQDVYALPFELEMEVIIFDLSEGRAELIDAPFNEFMDESRIKDSHKKIRDRAMEIIKPIVESRPSSFYSDQRWDLITEAVTRFDCGHRAIYRYLRRYWQKGQKGNALLPDYQNSGGRGKTRLPGEKKRGRPRKHTDNFGLNITEDIRKTFRVAVSRYYMKNKRFSMKDCYLNMLKDFFVEKRIDPYNGYITVIPTDGHEGKDLPTQDQFQYWVDKDNDRLEMKRRRMTPRVYDKDMRGLISTSNSEVWGPGARFQIDATIADIYLVSRIDRNKIIGRPVIYVVIDVYSRMVVGLYIGIEGPSWVGAMMAVANTVEDKQAFCRRFGREIEPHEWPCHYLPAVLLGDGGEIAGHFINSLINNYHVEVENTAPFRADWKGIVEQRFRLLPAVFGPYVDGYIEVDYQERGAPDYRLDATLDIDQFTRIIIDSVLYFNNFHEIRNYDKDHDLAAADFAAVPIDLWEWGIANKSGTLRRYPAEKVKFSLMPTGMAVITEFGIKFKSSFYTCSRAIKERWFDIARQSGRKNVVVSYDLRDMDNIYLHDPQDPSGYEVCQMTPRSRAYKDRSGWEIEQAELSSKQKSAEHAPTQRLAAIEMIVNTEAIVEKAREMKPQSTGQSAASRTGAIRENRAAEKELIRKTEAFRFGDAAKPVIPKNTENVVPIHSDDDDYSEPDITQIIRAGQEDNDG